jgi:hypothetical protein
MGGSSEQKKSGGGSKIGRNKHKCEKYRFTHGRIEGNKKPKYGKRMMRPLPGYVGDDAFVPEDRIPKFVPLYDCPHVSTECLERGQRTGANYFKSCSLTDAAEELARHLRPDMKRRVLSLPKREDKTPKHGHGPKVIR